VENSAKKLTDLSLSQAVSAMMRMVAKKTVEVYLHWSEYVNGQWTTRESGELTPVITGEVDASFTPNSVFIHVSKEPYDNGEERGVFIHLGGAIQKAFYLAGRNSAPEKGVYTAPPTNPFSSANAQDATRHKGTSALKVSFKEKLTTEPGQTQTVLQAERDILGQGATYTLLPCDNDLLPLGVSEDAYRNAANPEAVKKAIESGLSEIATLMKPVFYQDNRHTFFVEPSVTEKTIEKWEEWVPKEPEPEPWWPPNDDIVVIPAPKLPLPDPGDPWPVHPDTRINPVPDRDWLINLATVLQFDDVLVGPTGWPGLAVAPEIDRLEGPLLNVNPASQVSVPVAVGATHTFERSGLAVTGGGLNIVGSAGLNAGLAKNINELNRSGLGASMPGAGRLGR
jgi:hypothetical protein